MVYRFVKSVIRSLKRQYGQPITLYKTTTQGTVDWTDGTVSGRTTSTKSIKRAVILPGRATRKFNYDITFLAANKNFTYGGFYDITQRDMIIDNKDIGTFGIDLDTRIRFDGSDYRVREFNEFEESNAVYLVASKIEGQNNES